MAGPAAVLRVLVNADVAKAQTQLSRIDRQVSETRARTEKAIKAQLGADFSPAGFAAYEAAVARAKRSASDKRAFKAALGGEFDPRAFNAYQGELTKIENANKRAETSHVRMGTSARKASGGVDKLRSSVIGLVKESAIISAFGIAAQAVSALGAAATATTAGLAPLTGALAAYPALASAGLQGLGTLKLAFAGVGTAVGGLNEQINKNSQAWKALTPEGKKFAEQLQAMKKPLLELSSTTQKGLMPGLASGLKQAMGNFAIFNRHIRATAETIGGLAAAFGRLVGSKGFGNDLDTQMTRNNVTITRLGLAAIHLFKAITNITLAAGPLVDWMTRITLSVAQNIDAWAKAGRESGKFTAFFEQTRRVMTEVGHIAVNLGAALVNIFKGAYPTGQSLLQILEGLSKRFREWTGSAQGQNAIRTFFEQQKPAMIEAGRLLGAIVQAFGRLGSGTQVAPLLAMIRTQLLPAFERLVQNTTASFGPAFVEALKNVMLIFTQLGGSSGPLVAVVTLFGKLAASVNWLLSNIPGLAPVIVGALVVSKVVAFGSALEGVGRKYLGLLGTVAKNPIVPRMASSTTPVPANTSFIAATPPTAERQAVTTRTQAIANTMKNGLQTAMTGVGIALGGVLMTQIAASIAGSGAASKWITAIGTGGSIGAAFGSIFGPLGAAGGAVIGGLAGAVWKWVTSGDANRAAKAWSQNFSAGISINIPPTQAAQLQAQVGPLFTAYQNAVQRLNQVMDLGANVKDLPQKIAAAQAGVNRAAYNLGWAATQQFQAGWNATPLKGTSAFIQSALGQLQQLPVAARQQAAQMMIQYTQQLVASGQLPKSAVGQMIAGIKAQFPGLANYFMQQGLGSDKALAAAMQLQNARTSLRMSMLSMQQEFGLTWIRIQGGVRALPQAFAQTYEALIGLTRDKSPQVRRAAVDQLNQLQRQGTAAFGTLSRSAGVILDQLRADTKTKTGAARDAAVTAYHQMRNRMRSALDDVAGHTWVKMEEARRAVGRRAGEARDAGSKAFWQLAQNIGTAVNAGAISTQEGAQIIAKTMNKQLKAFGVAPIAGAAITGITQVTQGVKGILGLGKQGGGYLGRPGAVGPDSIPIMAAPGEAVLNRHQQKYVNAALQQTYGTNLPGLFSKVKTPHAMQKGGIAGFAQGGLTASAVNQATGAGRVQFSGPVSTFGPPGEAAGPTAYGRNSAQPGLSLRIPGTHWSDPQNRALMGHMFNLRVAGRQGNFLDFDLGPADWTGKNIDVTGAAVQAMGFNYGAFPTGSIGTVTQLGPGAIATIGAAVGAQVWKAIKAPKVAGSGTVAKIVRAALGKMTDAANKYGEAHMPAIAPGGGAGVSTAGITGKGGAGTFDGYTVANWIVPILNWARGHGWTGHITSGYRAGSITTAGNRSNHASLNYPGGAVDVGDASAVAQGMALWNVIQNYPGTPKLYSAAWGPGAWTGYTDSSGVYHVHDYGHFSATGHQRGGLIGQLMASGGAPVAGKVPGKGKPIPPAWRRKGYGKSGWQGVKGDPRPVREKLSPGWGKMPTGGAGIGPTSSQLRQVAANAGKAERVIGKGGPLPFGEGDIASISAMLSQLDKLEGIGGGQLGAGDVGKQSSLIQWFENSFWSSGLFPDPNFSSWNTPGNFVITQDAAGNQITPYVSPHIDQVVQQLGQSLGWFNAIVADHQAAVATINALLPRIRQAINRRVEWIAKIRARITQNLKRISDLQAKVKAEQARKLPYAKPKDNAQKSANTAFGSAQKQRIDAWNTQIGWIQDENKVLTGAKDGTGTTGELATLTAELGTRPGGLLASYMGGSSASGLYQLRQSAQDWVGQIGAGGGLLDQAKLDRDLRANGLAALKPGASAAAATAAAAMAAAQQSSATAATDNSQLLQLLQDWKTSQARDRAVAATQAAVLSQPLVGAFASGGTVPRTGFALVGEQGPELAALPQGTRVYSNATTNNIMQGSGGHDVHLHFAPGTEWLRQFVDVRVEQKTRKAAGNRAPLPGARG